jgi:non-ribosomal peptide synthetase component F
MLIPGSRTLLQRIHLQNSEPLVQGRPPAEDDAVGSRSNIISKSDLEFWKATLAGALPLLELPTDRARPTIVSYAGGRVAVQLTAELTAGIRCLSQRHGGTSFMTLLSAWSILLSRLTGRSDIVIGTKVPSPQRNDTGALSGCSANLLALRVRLTPEQRVADLLLQIKTSTLQAYAHQDVPLMEIVDALELPGDLSYHPIFQVTLSVDDASEEEPGADRRAEEDDDFTDAQVKAKFDLTLALTDDGKNITGFLEYASDLFERSTIESMAGQLQAVLEVMIADDRQYLSAPNLLSLHRDQRPPPELAAPAAGTDARCDALDPRSPRSSSVEVEGAAANSAAVLGYIRHALERMGAIQDPLNAEEPARLLIRLDGKTAVWHLLGRRTTIGRTAENDVRIDAEFISRHHAVALRDGDDTVIEDLQSTNGTYVNGERISRRTLRDGDLVTLGTMELHFSASKSPA